MANDNKTEKATPKRREDARKKGTVARSADLTGAVILLTGLMVLGMTGGSMAQRLGDVMRTMLGQTANSDVVSSGGVGSILMQAMGQAGLALAPVVFACALAAIVANAAQVGGKPRPAALKPDPKRLNPLKGAKNLFGPNALFETGKNLLKVVVVMAIVMMSLLPHLQEKAGMVGISPIEMGSHLTHDLRGLALRAGLAYLLIGMLDYFYQRHKTEKSLKMEKQEVKDESKGQQLPAEVRGAIRRRQMEQSRARMMGAVPEADVIITNPTHYAVALKYDGQSAAPTVLAKGMDHIAFKIREIAGEAGVPIVPDPPLARSLHASVEVGEQIPEELFEAVAQVLAYVYRVAGRRKALAT
jgi:flagellar biosynthetic protein FlhB